MRTLKEIYNALNESKEIYKHKNVKVFPTNHSIQRKIERMESNNKEILEHIFKKGIEKINTSKDNAYLIYSNKYNQGIVFGLRADVYSEDDNRHLFMITILPKFKKKVKHGTELLLVESYKKYKDYNILIIE